MMIVDRNLMISDLDLIDYLEGKCSDPKKESYIAKQWETPGSAIAMWYERFFWKAANFEMVDWQAIWQKSLVSDSEADGVDEQARSNKKSHASSVVSAVGAESGLKTTDYSAMTFRELMAELPQYTPAYRSDPLSPFRPALREAVCEVWWNESKKRELSEIDEADLIGLVGDVLFKAGIKMPFPESLVAAILVKEGLDDFCERKF